MPDASVLLESTVVGITIALREEIAELRLLLVGSGGVAEPCLSLPFTFGELLRVTLD